MVVAIMWFGREREAFHAMRAGRYRSRAQQHGETRPRSAAIGASNVTQTCSLVSSAKLAQQSCERLLHADDHDGAEQRACGYPRLRRYRNLPARRPGAARADRAEPPWRDRAGCNRAGAAPLPHATGVTDAAD